MFNDLINSDTDNVLEEMSGEWMRRQLEAATAAAPPPSRDEHKEAEEGSDSTSTDEILRSLSAGVREEPDADVIPDVSEDSEDDDLEPVTPHADRTSDSFEETVEAGGDPEPEAWHSASEPASEPAPEPAPEPVAEPPAEPVNEASVENADPEPTIAKLSNGLSSAIVTALTEFDRVRARDQDRLLEAIERQGEQLSELAGRVGDVRGDLERLTAEIQDTKTDARGLREEFSASQQRLGSIDGAVQSVTESAETSTKELSRVQDRIDSLKDGIERASRRLDGQKDAIRSVREAENRRRELLQQLNEVTAGSSDDLL